MQSSSIISYGKHIEIRARNGISPMKPVILIAAAWFVTLDAIYSNYKMAVCTLYSKILCSKEEKQEILVILNFHF